MLLMLNMLMHWPCLHNIEIVLADVTKAEKSKFLTFA